MNEDVNSLVSWDSVTRDLEVALCITAEDYSSSDFDGVIKQVKSRIQSQYAISLDDRDGVNYDKYLKVIYGVYMKLCTRVQLDRFNTETVLNLKQANYFGVTRDSLMQLLRVLQRAESQYRAEDALQAMKQKLSICNVSLYKRLFLCLLTTYELNLNSVTASIAEGLFQACL